MISFEYCEIFKNTYFEELLGATSDFLKQLQNCGEQLLLHSVWTINSFMTEAVII